MKFLYYRVEYYPFSGNYARPLSIPNDFDITAGSESNPRAEFVSIEVGCHTWRPVFIERRLIGIVVRDVHANRISPQENFNRQRIFVTFQAITRTSSSARLGISG